MTEEAVPLTPEQMKEMAEKDPNFKKKLVEQVRNMSDEDFMAAMDASGDAPEMTPAMLQVAKAQFLAMDDDELLLCMGLQDSTMDGRTEEDLMQKMQKNSAANAQALEAMGQMSEDEILQMSKMAGTMPGGQELDSAQLKEGIKAMKELKQEDLEKLNDLMQEAQDDPELMAKLMKGGAKAKEASGAGDVSKDYIKGLAASMGQELTEVQAEMLAKILNFVVAVKSFFINKWFLALALVAVLLSIYMRQQSENQNA